MNNNLNFTFDVDLDAKKVTIVKEFDADREAVWDAFTKKEILDQWWAPKPWSSETTEMNFIPGGKRVYAMVSPEGAKNWAMHEYKTINAKSNYSMLNAFSDEQGNPSLPGSDWTLDFSEQDGVTTVHINIYNESRERMQEQIEMGFREGFTATLTALGEMLSGRK